MSLLLDALKKAALEKQRREHPSGTGTQAAAAVVPASQLDVPTPDSSTSVEQKSVNEVSTIAPEILPETAAPIHHPSDESLPLTLEPSEDFRVNAEEEKDELEFNIDEMASEFLAATDQPHELSNNLHANSNRVTAPEVPVESDLSPVEHQRENPVAIPQQPAPAPQQRAADIPIAYTNVVEQFSAPSGKAALAQLLDRSQKAANYARKRMLVMYAMLATTAILLVVFYYYLLHSSSPMMVALPPPAETMSADAAVSGEEPASAPAASAEEPVATDVQAITEANNGEENEVVENELEGKVSPAEEIVQLEDENFQHPERQASHAEFRASPQGGLQRKNTQTAAPSSFEQDGDTRISLPPEHLPKQAIIAHQQPAEYGVSEAIARGYAAYQRGDLASATQAYAQALEQDPYQRDALLGAAAVAVREGRQQDALGFYQQRLARDPKDEYAQAGILALNSNGEQNPQLDSELNRLLLAYPDAAHLHFLKGSLYAGREQWAAAQLAFFEAWQRDNKNPDVAFNLAVALDHLNQPKEAIRFYQQALVLGNARPVGFSLEATQRRLQDLEARRVQQQEPNQP